MIYLVLEGRIGNQIFMYAVARQMQKQLGDNTKIIIDDTAVVKLNWEDSLKHYDLKNVQYISDKSLWKKMPFKSRLIVFLYDHLGFRLMNFRKRYEFQKKYQNFFNKNHLIMCENGYIDLPKKIDGDVILKGYFQSYRYLEENKQEILDIFSAADKVNESDYPGLEKIKNRNSVCISIKVEHNVGSKLYDVCTREYWEKAIEYIIDHVENPLFFICSDNVDYVLEHFIDANKYDVVMQSKDFPVYVSLGVMSQCKHFIIGNTSFGWWAQYLAQNPEKIVVTPSRWYGIDVPCDLYMDNWVKIDV